MGQFFHKAHTENPSSPEKPWSLPLYSDEVVPGNPLASRINRKVYAIYGSFAQHKTKLQCEDAWLILAILPSTILAELEASIGQVFAKLIEAIFLGPACDPRNGLYVPHSVTSMDAMLYFDLGGFVQDGFAMKQTFNIKGASGDKFCMLCSNIRAISFDLPPDTPEEDIPGSHVCKLANCILSTDQEVLDAFQVCKEKSTTLPKKQFELWEKACGITFSHHALLLNQTLLDSHLLKPISGYIHDWMHTMASQGVIQRSIWLLLSQLDMWDQLDQFLQLWTLPKAMAKAGNLLDSHLLKPISGYIHDWMHTMASQGVIQRSIWLLLSQLDMWDQLDQFLQLWTLPKAMAKAGNLHDLFQAKRNKFYKENSKFKCTASEAIGLSTMLACLVNTICVPAAAHLEALEMLQATQLGQVQPPMLQHLGSKVCMHVCFCLHPAYVLLKQDLFSCMQM